MALTEELTYQLGTTVLNTDSLSLPFVDVYKVRGLDSAPPRETERDWEGNEGTFLDAEFEKGRPVLLDAFVIADPLTLESYLDQLKADWAASPTLKQFFFKKPGVNERFLYVKPLGVRYDSEQDRRFGQISAQFRAFAEDPRIYDAQQGTQTINLGATVFTGFSFNLGFNFGFGGVSTTTDTVNITVSGNRPTPPKFIIQGPITNPRILNDTIGQEMIFTGLVLTSTEFVVVDTKYKTVLLNGVTNRRNTLINPTWFELTPGLNTLRFRAESNDPASSLTIQYYPAWR